MKNTKLKNTVQRQLIYNAVKELNVHASAEQVFEYVALKHPSIGKATVYRNLRQMAQNGQLVYIGDFYGCARYDHHLHPHYHFVCDKCRTVFDVEGDFSHLLSDVQSDNFKVAGCNISFSGLCKNCT
ncbi:MAG: transcriptional repressor [Firmicutes bacterium]|nr:transcriptional repressor [Bacillota bacterium]